MGGSVKALQRAGEELHRLRGARLSRPTGRTRYMRAGGACLWGRGHKNWWARPVPQKGKETPGAMPGRALWDSRPVVPRDWGPLSAVAEDGDGDGEALLENNMLVIPRVLT